jgi:hypothetical protein
MSRFNVNAVRCEALFVSALQPSDAPSAPRVREAIRRTVQDLGSRGCAARVAQEFGDHPEVAIMRMRWAREAVERAFDELRSEAPEPSRMRQYAVAQSIA